ncbi:TRAP transporter small permease [Alkalihalobacillus sp. MEB130]|uniref:TRAP transporter small permease n=1 Tax=Alkalihalobacillus sp. MEB130 TaxID=2976704 RepID=UPI0028DE5D73|nr:TRAP transporter small permease [Alkalihalobacillus sp. MEB130]MDT8862880.1 TRAP transporter small permease [Alkalihalobacillus sp. MEB130]
MKFLLKVQKSIMFFSSLLIIIGLSLTVFFRYVLKLDIFAIDELLLIPTFLIYFMGAATASYENSHISADIVDSYVKSKIVKSWISLIVSILTFVTCVVMTIWTTEFVLWSFDNGGKTLGWQIPLFIPYATVLLGFVLMCVYSLVHVITKILSVFRKVGV